MASIRRLSRSLKSNCLKNALTNYILPVVVDHYEVYSFRTVWEVTGSNDEEYAEQFISGKRQQLQNVLGQVAEVVFLFTCITALQRKPGRKKRKAATDADADGDGDADESQEDNGEEVFCPGKKLTTVFMNFKRYSVFQMKSSNVRPASPFPCSRLF